MKNIQRKLFTMMIINVIMYLPIQKTTLLIYHQSCLYVLLPISHHLMCFYHIIVMPTCQHFFSRKFDNFNLLFERMFEMNKNIYERVVKLCDEKGISQRELQRQLNIAIGTITKWKTATPKPETLQKVADYFNVTTDYLTGRTKYRNKDHMLQSFDLNFKPDVDNAETPYDYCIQTDEGIVLIESMSAAPKYIDDDTRQLAEKIMEDDQLKRILNIMLNLPTKQRDAVYNMINAMKNE